MKKLIIASIISAFAFGAQAADKSGVYLTGKIGASVLNASDQKIYSPEYDLKYGGKSKTVFGGGVALGYDFAYQYNCPTRLELDYMARAKGKYKTTILDTDFESYESDSKVDLQTVMVNAYYDIETTTRLTPYVTAGIGYARAKLTMYGYDESISSTNNNFAWSIGVGAKYAINNDLALDLGYRYLDAGKSDIKENDGKYETKVKTNDFMLGLSYYF